MAKPQTIRLHDIDHNGVYTVNGLFVRIPMAKTEGYLRGTVEVKNIRRSHRGFFATVIVETFTGKNLSVAVTRGPGDLDDWVFSASERPTLFKASKENVSGLLAKTREEIFRATQEEKHLIEILQIFERQT